MPSCKPCSASPRGRAPLEFSRAALPPRSSPTGKPRCGAPAFSRRRTRARRPDPWHSEAVRASPVG
eukprot:322879-Lingulodinium_polyedra.AAC.1